MESQAYAESGPYSKLPKVAGAMIKPDDIGLDINESLDVFVGDCAYRGRRAMERITSRTMPMREELGSL